MDAHILLSGAKYWKLVDNTKKIENECFYKDRKLDSFSLKNVSVLKSCPRQAAQNETSSKSV